MESQRARAVRRANMAPHSVQTESLDDNRCRHTGQANAAAIVIGLFIGHRYLGVAPMALSA